MTRPEPSFSIKQILKDLSQNSDKTWGSKLIVKLFIKKKVFVLVAFSSRLGIKRRVVGNISSDASLSAQMQSLIC